MESIEFDVETDARTVTDLTEAVRGFCRGRGDGLCNVFVPHATAGVALIETGSGSETDLERSIDRLLPLAGEYRHRHGTTGHGRDHVLPAFVSPSVSIPVIDGSPALGVWQSVVLVDTNRDNPRRRVRLSFVR